MDVGVTTEEWNLLARRWDVFRAGSGIDDTSAPSQLFQCAGTELGDSLLKVNANPVTDTVTQLLASMRSLAVIPIATGVLRTELLQLRQERDKTFWAFAARVRGKAETCDSIAACECGNNVDYTSHVIRDVLLSGISDPDIQREVLGTSGILKKAVNDVIALVENKEMARNALPSSTMSAVSSFQRRNETLAAPTTTTTATPPQTDKGKRAPCPDCKQPFNYSQAGTPSPTKYASTATNPVAVRIGHSAHLRRLRLLFRPPRETLYLKSRPPNMMEIAPVINADVIVTDTHTLPVARSASSHQ